MLNKKSLIPKGTSKNLSDYQITDWNYSQKLWQGKELWSKLEMSNFNGKQEQKSKYYVSTSAWPDLRCSKNVVST